LLQTVVKQFIRNVRAAKTIADERAVIQKESAAIRASFREEGHDHGIRWVFNVESLRIRTNE
jgi:AP-1 complex subunit gamma-1